MKAKTIFNWINADWKRVKNHCRTTDNKEFTENEATETFIKKLLISEHTPIRLIEFDWSWKQIPYWVSTEWSRHKFEKFISTQGALVNYDGYANEQNAIDAERKRLCCQCTPEARRLGESFKADLHTTNPLESDVLVPNCIYRCGCPEFNKCGFFDKFKKWTEDNNKEIDWFDIQSRYDAYNEYFYSIYKS